MCGLRNAGSVERRKIAGGPEERRAEKNREKNRKNAAQRRNREKNWRKIAENVRDSENNVFRTSGIRLFGTSGNNRV